MVTTSEISQKSKTISTLPAHDKLQALLDTVNGFEQYTLDDSGVIISSNLELVTITGYEEWEIIGKHISILYPPEDIGQDLPGTDLAKARESGKHICSGFRVKKKGSRFFAKMKFTTLDQAKHGLCGFQVILYDTTHRAMCTVRTRTMKEEYYSLFNNPFVGIFKFRMKDFAITLLNDRGLQIVGKERKDLTFREIFHNENDFIRFEHSLMQQRTLNDFEFRLNSPEEKYCSISCKLFSYRGIAEGILNDITEKRNHLNQIESLHRELDTFLYHASHDIRAPLPTVQGLVNLIKSDPSMDSIQLYAEKIEHQIKHMDGLLRDLSSIALNNVQPVAVEKIDVDKLLDDIVKPLFTDYPFIKLITEIRSHRIFYSDRNRVATIFKNLVLNAFQFASYSYQYPRVQITIQVTAQSLIVQIEDNGCGIEKKYLTDIFKIFFKIDSRGKGSGLGLYVVQSILKKLKGSVSINSTLGIGTCVSFTIPNAKPFKS